MLNILRADFYKLFRKKSFYVCSILLIILSIMNVYTYYSNVKSWFDKGMQMAALGMNMFSVIPQGVVLPSIFCTIVISIFISDEFSFGTIKNLISSGAIRVNIYLSKLVISLFVSVVFTVICAITSFIAGVSFMGFSEVTRDDYLNLFKMIGLVILAQFAVQSIYSMISFLVQNKTVAVSTNILIDYLLNFVVSAILIFAFAMWGNVQADDTSATQLMSNVIKCWPGNLVRSFASLRLIPKDISFGVIVCLVSILISTFVGMFTFCKRDVK